MPDSDETEDQILARIETALQKIAAAGKPARPDGVDKAAVARALDDVIGRLKGGLDPEPPKHDPVP